MTGDGLTWRTTRAARWTSVFFVNLILPLPLGLLCFDDASGACGVIVACVAIWAGGGVVCSRVPRIGEVLVRGGYTVAFCQCLPILQIVSGILALLGWEGLGISTGDAWIDDVLQGFVVTHLTAMPILLAALVLGGGHRLLLGSDEADDESHEESGRDSEYPITS